MPGLLGCRHIGESTQSRRSAAPTAAAMTSTATARSPETDLSPEDGPFPSRRPPLRWRRVLLQLGVGTLVGAALVVVGLQQVPLADVLRTLREAGLLYVAAAAAAAAGFILARTWRYQALLYPTGWRSLARRPSRGATVATVALASWGPGLILPTPTAD